MGKKPAAKSADSSKKEKEVKVEAKAEKVEVKAKKHHEHKIRSEQHCKVGGCKREYRAKGYCNVHYKKWRQGEFGLGRYKTCQDHECRKPMTMNRHGYCEEHYQNFFVKGVKSAPAAEAPKKDEAPAAEKASA